MPIIRDALSAIGAVGRFALLGAVSGSVAIALILTTRLIEVYSKFDYGILGWIDISPITVVPGLFFGLIIGSALYRGGLAGPWAYAVYVVASTLSTLAATNLVLLTAWITHHDAGPRWPVIMVAGLFASACLTGVAASMFPFVRKFWPIVLMLAAGCVPGTLFVIIDSKWALLSLFAVWQACYAAAFATALPGAKG